MSDERYFRVEVHYGDSQHTDHASGEDGDQAIAKVWGRLRRQGALCLAMAYTAAEAIEVDVDPVTDKPIER